MDRPRGPLAAWPLRGRVGRRSSGGSGRRRGGRVRPGRAVPGQRPRRAAAPRRPARRRRDRRSGSGTRCGTKGRSSATRCGRPARPSPWPPTTSTRPRRCSTCGPWRATRELADGLATGAAAAWEKRGRRWLRRLADSVEARHRQAAEVAFHLEPDLKSGRGGLRDVHALRWASRARQVLLDDDLATLDAAYARLLAARVALHLQTGRVLRRPDAPGAGRRGRRARHRRGLAHGRPRRGRPLDRVALPTRPGTAVRSLLAGPGWAFTRTDRAAGDGLVLRDREVHLLPDADPATDPTLVLRAAAEAASRDTRIDRASLDLLAERAVEMPDPWPAAGPRCVRRAAVGRSAGHRGDRGARPARRVGAHPARVGAGAVAAAAQRLPPLHRRPAPVRGRGQRGRPDRPGVPARPARAGRAAARHRQGAARRPHRGRAWTSSPASGPRLGLPPEDVDVLVDAGPPPPAAARRGHPPRPRRPRHDRRGGRVRSATAPPSSCSTR